MTRYIILVIFALPLCFMQCGGSEDTESEILNETVEQTVDPVAEDNTLAGMQ